MENKNVGYILLGISLLVILIIFMFNSTLTDIVDSSCTLAHGEEYCPMYDTINKQTYLALGIVGLLILVSLVLIFNKPKEKVIIKKVIEKQKKKEFDLTGLTGEEKQVYNMVLDNKAIFQGDIIEKTGFGKAKMTRIIDRLEGRGLVERKRRGMTNIVVLKD